jgi:hypothetical protein
MLSVSTFPFLAVLLCAMGSLILLLLVIDRRAKVVMRAKALETVRQMESAEKEEAAVRDAEWEKRRQALHEQLEQQKQDLDAKSASLERQLAGAAQDLQTELAQTPVLEKKLQTEQENLLWEERAIAFRIRETNQKMQESKATQAELARSTTELVKMEQTLDDLKALRQRQQQTYSLVPYRGRRGDNRRPIYVECAAASLIFHPDRLTIPATDSNGSAILQEVERRINGQQSSVALQAPKKETSYLLLLVRPDGIMTYYRILAALRNLQVDFGYEFVESDWILDFPSDDKTAPTQPWMAASSARASDTSTIPGKTSPMRPAPKGLATRGEYGLDESAKVSPGLGPGSGPINSGSTLGGNSAAGYGMTRALGNGRMIGTSGRTDVADPGTSRGAEGTPGLHAGGSSTDGARSTGAFQGQSGVTLGTAKPRGVSFAGASGSSGMSQPANKGSAPLDVAPGGTLARSSERGELSPGFSPEPATQSFGRDPPEGRLPLPVGNNVSPVVPQSEFGNGNGAGGAQMTISGNSNPGSEKSGMAAGGNPKGPFPTNSSGGQPSPSLISSALSSGGSSQPGSLSGAPAQPSSPETEEAGHSLGGSSGLSQIGAPREKKPEPLPAVRRYIRREWNIFVECTADQIVVYPGGLRIPAAELGEHGKAGSRPLLQAVQQMTARRQAVISSLEMPKDNSAPNPQIRFLVRPNGLRTCFLAYPELELLHLPMTRENLDADEDVIRHMTGR